MSEIEKMLSDPMVLRELVMDHYQYPHNHKLTRSDLYRSVHMASESCIDDITVESRIENGVIEDIQFEGEACTISTSSTSIMTDLLIGKTVEEAKEIIRNYFDMVDGKEYDPELLQEALVMRNVHKQANRIKCATIGWNAMKQMIEESEASHE